MPKKPEPEDRLRQVLKVAHLFYEKEMTKTEISHEIRASSTQVARLLAEAREQGFVRIEFSPPKLYDLGERLRRRFDWLREAIVVSTADDLAFLRRMIGKAAAQYFESAVGAGSLVALGGGDTMYEMVMALPQTQRDVRLVPAAIIDSGPVLTHIDPAVLVSLLWVRSGRQAGYAHLATGLPFNRLLPRQKMKEEYEQFSRRKAVQEVLMEMKRADFLFTSLGCLKADPDYLKLASRPHTFLLENLRLTESGLQREGVIGDLNYSFFDAHGKTSPNWNIFPALGVEAVREMIEADKTVVVAAGKYKLEALQSALKGRLLNVLITDEQAAEALLAERSAVLSANRKL
jgi:DNA-binding transcriptional regulator LsrR (DeoR family)